MTGRRGFLRQLAALPLIGGGVTLIGQPTAVATPITYELLARYTQWLAVEFGESLIERSYLKRLRENPDRPEWAETERRWRREWCQDTPPLNCFADFREPPVALPSSRAALVLSTVGCDWCRPHREALR